MNKLTKIILVTLLILSLASCSKKGEVANPIKEYQTAEEVYDATNVHIISLAITGKESERFYTIEDEIAAHETTANGFEYTLRGNKKLNEDISGIYDNDETLFAGKLDTQTTQEPNYIYAEGGGFKASRFVIKDTQYVFDVKDDGALDKNQFFLELNEAYKQLLFEFSSEESIALVGLYQDTTSKRASAEISLYNSEELLIDVFWSNSATEYDSWTIVAKVDNNKLIYDDITHLRNNNTTSTNLKDYEPGYFEIVDGKLLWTGSGNEATENCVFEILK